MRELTTAFGPIIRALEGLLATAPSLVKWMIGVFALIVVVQLVIDRWKSRREPIPPQDLAYTGIGLAVLMWGLGR